MIGSQDSANHFHVNGIMIGSHERGADYTWALKAQKELRSSGQLEPAFNVGDGSDCISEGFESVHPLTPRGMCFPHVLRNVRKYFGNIKNKARVAMKESFVEDVKDLHRAWTVEVKSKAISLFILKWEALSLIEGNNYLVEIVRLFRQQWLDKIRTNRWSYCDAPDNKNVDNNGLESYNKVLKDEVTDHRLPTLLLFFEHLQTWLSRHSGERNPDAGPLFLKPFHTEPKPAKGEWEQSYEVCTSKSNKYNMFCEDGVAIMLNPMSLNTKSLTKETYTVLKKQLQELDWARFENYKSFLLKAFVVEKRQEKWRCSCYNFGLKHFCEHEHKARWRYDDWRDIPKLHQRTEVQCFRKRGKGRPSNVASCMECTPSLIPESYDEESDFE